MKLENDKRYCFETKIMPIPSTNQRLAVQILTENWVVPNARALRGLRSTE